MIQLAEPSNHHFQHADPRMRACVDAVMFAYSVDELGALLFAIIFGDQKEQDRAILDLNEAVQSQFPVTDQS